MCHQSVGLIAKQIEQQGIPTVCLSSALSITQSVKAPRAVYIDYPLGHTAGKPHNPDDQEFIMRRALSAITDITEPGSIIDLGRRWSDNDEWKDAVMRPSKGRSEKTSSDDRIERFSTPQYQTSEDAEVADAHCPTCIFTENTLSEA